MGRCRLRNARRYWPSRRMQTERDETNVDLEFRCQAAAFYVCRILRPRRCVFRKRPRRERLTRDARAARRGIADGVRGGEPEGVGGSRFNTSLGGSVFLVIGELNSPPTCTALSRPLLLPFVPAFHFRLGLACRSSRPRNGRIAARHERGAGSFREKWKALIKENEQRIPSRSTEQRPFASIRGGRNGQRWSREKRNARPGSQRDNLPIAFARSLSTDVFENFERAARIVSGIGRVEETRLPEAR